jgi:hypothetical protein
MPESKTDQAHRSLEEISNYHDCGDARGREWLHDHPEAQARADLALRGLVAGHGAPESSPDDAVPSQPLSAAG